MKAEELHLASVVAWDSRDGKLLKSKGDEQGLSFGDRFVANSEQARSAIRAAR